MRTTPDTNPGQRSQIESTRSEALLRVLTERGTIYWHAVLAVTAGLAALVPSAAHAQEQAPLPNGIGRSAATLIASAEDFSDPHITQKKELSGIAPAEFPQNENYLPPEPLPEPFGAASPVFTELTSLGKNPAGENMLGIAVRTFSTDLETGEVTGVNITTAQAASSDLTTLTNQREIYVPLESIPTQRIASLEVQLLPDGNVLLSAYEQDGDTNSTDRFWVVDTTGSVIATLESPNMYGKPVVVGNQIIFAEQSNSIGQRPQPIHKVYATDLSLGGKELIWQSGPRDTDHPSEILMLTEYLQVINNTTVLLVTTAPFTINLPNHLIAIQRTSAGWETYGPIADFSERSRSRQVVGNPDSTSADEDASGPTIAEYLEFVLTDTNKIKIYRHASDGTRQIATVTNPLTAGSNSETIPLRLIGVHEALNSAEMPDIQVVFSAEQEGTTSLYLMTVVAEAFVTDAAGQEPVATTDQYIIEVIAQYPNSLIVTGGSVQTPAGLPAAIVNMRTGTDPLEYTAIAPKQPTAQPVYLPMVSR